MTFPPHYIDDRSYVIMSEANQTQVGGAHYKSHGREDLQHWDVVSIFNLDYFQGNVSKYLFRWRSKNGVEDLKKARHYLDKYIELAEAELGEHRITLNVPGARGQITITEYEPQSVEDQLSELSSSELLEEVQRRGEPALVSLTGYASQELLEEVMRRARTDEQAAMEEHARSLSGDLVDEDAGDTSYSLPAGDDIPLAYHAESRVSYCAGCGAVLNRGAVTHAPECLNGGAADRVGAAPDTGAPTASPVPGAPLAGL